HLGVLHDDQIARLRGANLVANIQLSWFHAGETGELYGYFGTSRAAKVGRWKDLVAAGVNVCGSTDFPWGAPVLGPVNRTLYSATTRRGPEGELPEPWMASQVLSIQQAIELLTSRAAWALGIEDERGSIGAGKKADLVVLSQDPVSMQPEDLLELETAMTIVDGHVEHIHPDHELLLSSEGLPAWFTP
ncbi:MAG: amidohydrolase family protein, partial [Actinomycetota bacterium]